MALVVGGGGLVGDGADRAGPFRTASRGPWRREGRGIIAHRPEAGSRGILLSRRSGAIQRDVGVHWATAWGRAREAPNRKTAVSRRNALPRITPACSPSGYITGAARWVFFPTPGPPGARPSGHARPGVGSRALPPGRLRAQGHGSRRVGRGLSLAPSSWPARRREPSIPVGARGTDSKLLSPDRRRAIGPPRCGSPRPGCRHRGAPHRGRRAGCAPQRRRVAHRHRGARVQDIVTRLGRAAHHRSMPAHPDAAVFATLLRPRLPAAHTSPRAQG